MANLNNMGVGKKLLDQVLNIKGPRVKHWYNQQNLTDNKLKNNFNIQPKSNTSVNKK